LTNTFAEEGDFAFSNWINPSIPQRYFLIVDTSTNLALFDSTEKVRRRRAKQALSPDSINEKIVLAYAKSLAFACH
jgi:hypothetical protein